MRAIVDRKALERSAASTSQMGRFETEWLATADNLAALADLQGIWIDRVHDRRPPKLIVLDMDSSVSPTSGDQEGFAAGTEMMRLFGRSPTTTRLLSGVAREAFKLRAEIRATLPTTSIAAVAGPFGAASNVHSAASRRRPQPIVPAPTHRRRHPDRPWRDGIGALFVRVTPAGAVLVRSSSSSRWRNRLRRDMLRRGDPVNDAFFNGLVSRGLQVRHPPARQGKAAGAVIEGLPAIDAAIWPEASAPRTAWPRFRWAGRIGS